MSPKKTTNSPDSKSHDYRATILKSIETLKIKMAPEELDSLVRDATEKGMSPWELLDRFLKSPANQSVQRSIERRIANAGLPTTATLEAFDWEFNAQTINGRGSTAFLTNVDFGDWTEYLGDPALVMALLDRVSDNAIIFRFAGKSYRKSRTKQAT